MQMSRKYTKPMMKHFQTDGAGETLTQSASKIYTQISGKIAQPLSKKRKKKFLSVNI